MMPFRFGLVPSAALATALFLIFFALWLGIASPPHQAYFPPSLTTTTAMCDPAPYDLEATAGPIQDQDEADWYAPHLRAAEEEPLWGKHPRPGEQTVRFTFLPSFDHPIVVRIDRRPGRPDRLTVTRLTGGGGYWSGSVSDRIVRDLTAAETGEFHRLLERTRVLDAAPTGCNFGLDGTRWIVEADGPDHYRYVNRWSPQRGPVYEAGRFMLRLAEFDYEGFNDLRL